jgi:periplasmic protein TonB
MLEDSLFESNRNSRTRTPATLVSSVVVHCMVVGVLIVIPLLQIQAVPAPRIDLSLSVSKPPDPQRPVEVFVQERRVSSELQIDPNDLIAPLAIRTEVAFLIDEPSMELSASGFRESRGVGSLLRELTGNPPEREAVALPSAVPVVAPSEPDPEPIRRGGTVQQANLIHQVLPSYPPIARLAGIRGVVVLEAVISKDGTIESLRVVSGHPFFSLH